MMKATSTIVSQDYELSRVSDALVKSINEVRAKTILDGVFLTATLIAGATAVAHGLGRVPQFWILMGQDSRSDIWENVGSTDDLFLSLSASALVGVRLWVG